MHCLRCQDRVIVEPGFIRMIFEAINRMDREKMELYNQEIYDELTSLLEGIPINV